MAHGPRPTAHGPSCALSKRARGLRRPAGRLCVVCCMAALHSDPRTGSAAPPYDLIDAGPIGFIVTPGDPVTGLMSLDLGTGTFGINGEGIVAFAVRVNGVPRAAVWLPFGGFGLGPGIHDLSALSGSDAPSIARDVTAHGTVVGQSGGITAGTGRATVWHLPQFNGSADPPQPLAYTLFQPGVADPQSQWTRAIAASESSAGLLVALEESRESQCVTECRQGHFCEDRTAECRRFVTAVAAYFDAASQMWTGAVLPNRLPGVDECVPGVLPGDVFLNALGQGMIAGTLAQVVQQDDPACPVQSAFCTSCGQDTHAGHWMVPPSAAPEDLTRLASIPPPPCPPSPPPQGAAARGISAGLDTVGYAWAASGAQCLEQAALWPAGTGTRVDLHAVVPTEPGLNRTRAEAVSGGVPREIVGFAPGTNIPILWTEAPLQNPPWTAQVLDAADLGQFPGGHCGDDVQVRHLLDVNDKGWIVAWGFAEHDEGPIEPHAFILIPRTCHGDINRDGTVDFQDMLLVLALWDAVCAPHPGGGATCGTCLPDLDGNGTIGMGDLLEVLANWREAGCASLILGPPQSVSDCIARVGLDPIALSACIESIFHFQGGGAP
ncbi:MAG: hypothetical protein KF817_05800 [Phycisphaeraceae bacterium]|nr:hypothetical protein [Phycisphaeraceae bacterium]